jgi:Flp pilus assembly protein TadD
MQSPFLSSEEYDERAHQLYNEGLYDEALGVLRQGLALYPTSVELHIGMGYARLARDEFAWARRSFEEALVLEPEHEDALAGLGETLMKFGDQAGALRCFRRTLDLGYADDVELMMQIGRALFRDGLVAEAKEFFEVAAEQAPESAEAVSCVGYAQHRLGDDDGAIATLRKALRLDGEHAEARVYLANILYDRGDYEASLYHFDRTTPDDHWDELGIWRLVELKKTLHGARDEDDELKPWEARIGDLTGEMDDIDELLAEIESRAAESDEPGTARQQLELFGALLGDLAATREEGEGHSIIREGRRFEGSWEEIVRSMRDANAAYAGRSVEEFMSTEARRLERSTGRPIPAHDAESFIRASADAGLLTIVR